MWPVDHDHQLAAYIRWLTANTVAFRTVLQERRGESGMALELKGLKAKAIKARSGIDALNSAYDKFNEAAPAHAADVAGLTEQISGMQDDLQFAVTTLGNSVADSSDPPLNGGRASADPVAIGPQSPESVHPETFDRLGGGGRRANDDATHPARGAARPRRLPGMPRQGMDRPVAARRAAQGIAGAV
jgi:hypothetical protein